MRFYHITVDVSENDIIRLLHRRKIRMHEIDVPAFIIRNVFSGIGNAPFIIVDRDNFCSSTLLREYGKYSCAGSEIEYFLSTEIDPAHRFDHQVSCCMMTSAETHLWRDDDLVHHILYRRMKIRPDGCKVTDAYGFEA